MSDNQELRRLPAVDELLRNPVVAHWHKLLPRPLIVQVVRECITAERQRVLRGEPARSDEAWNSYLQAEFALVQQGLLQPVINATGVILHTNLGRAPLSVAALEAVSSLSAGYSNLELDLTTGQRGSRHVHGETMLRLLTDAEAAMVVNNGAAAILLALSALAAKKEVILSRGEMIEIGGSFRIPEVMEQSGCRLVEVGTTNRTHLRDYERAITAETGALLKVHTSNYRITGFTSDVTGGDLATLAQRRGIPLIHDLGSGVLLDTERFDLRHEPTVPEALSEGADIVTFSGDKLLGGPQAGFILGRAEFVQQCKKHPLARVVRVGKLTLAALQSTLHHYLQGEAEEEIPVWMMCGLTPDSIGERAANIAGILQQAADDYGTPVQVTVEDGQSSIGGGSLPGETLPTRLLAIAGQGILAPHKLATSLRRNRPAVMARIEEGKLLLDLRTVAREYDGLLTRALLGLLEP